MVEAPQVEKKARDNDNHDGPDLFYVCKRALLEVREKMKNAHDITLELVRELALSHHLDDNEIMVPVDMRGIGEQHDGVEGLIEELGPKGAAEAFVKAADNFEVYKGQLHEDECLKEITAKEWREVLEEEDEDDDEDEEEDMEESEEQESVEADEEQASVAGEDTEESESLHEEDATPSPKKARTE